MKITNELLKEIGFNNQDNFLFFELQINDIKFLLNQCGLNSETYNYHSEGVTPTNISTMSDLLYCISIDFRKRGEVKKQKELQKALGL